MFLVVYVCMITNLVHVLSVAKITMSVCMRRLCVCVAYLSVRVCV